MQPKRWQDSATETVQVVLPNDSNPLGFILGGTVMHLIDITGAIACHRHTNSLALTAAVDGLEFVHTIRVGDMIILKSRVTGTFTTSLEVEVEVFSEAVTTGERRADQPRLPDLRRHRPRGRPQPVPPLLETDDDGAARRRARQRRPSAVARKRETSQRERSNHERVNVRSRIAAASVQAHRSACYQAHSSCRARRS